MMAEPNYRASNQATVLAWFKYHLYLQNMGRKGHVVDFVAGYNAALQEKQDEQDRLQAASTPGPNEAGDAATTAERATQTGPQ